MKNDEPAPEITVYTDGSCTDNGSMEAKAGAGIWYGLNDPRNRAIRLPENLEQSNNTGELIAILAAIQDVPSEANLKINTDSQYAIDGIHERGRISEQRGWIDISNKEIIKATIAAIRARVGDTYFLKVKGHSGNAGNDGADELARQGAEKLHSDEINLAVPIDYVIEGAELRDLSQAQLYRGIREKLEEDL